MKSFFEYIIDIQTEQSKINEKIHELTDLQKENDLIQTEILVNQEYANCLMELNQAE